jgi:hypothetical protein
MAKKNQDSTMATVLVVIAAVLAALVFISYAVLIVVPPIIIGVGFFVTALISLVTRRVRTSAAFQLSKTENNKLRLAKRDLKTKEKDLESAEASGSEIRKRGDGSFDERSQVGKQLNKLIPRLSAEVAELKSEVEYLTALPRNRQKNYVMKKARPVAYLLAAGVYLGICWYFVAHISSWTTTVQEFITYIPNFITTHLHQAIYGSKVPIDDWWFYKLSTYKFEYQAPMLLGSIISTVSYPIFLFGYGALINVRFSTPESGNINTNENQESITISDSEKPGTSHDVEVQKDVESDKPRVGIVSILKKIVAYFLALLFFLFGSLLLIVSMTNAEPGTEYIVMAVAAVFGVLSFISFRFGRKPQNVW